MPLHHSDGLAVNYLCGRYVYVLFRQSAFSGSDKNLFEQDLFREVRSTQIIENIPTSFNFIKESSYIQKIEWNFIVFRYISSWYTDFQTYISSL